MRNYLSRFSKHRKLAISLLLLSLVGVASAAVYIQLNLRTIVTVNKAKVNFCTTACAVAPQPADAGSTLANAVLGGGNNTYASLNNVKAFPNATTTYQQAIGVQNTDSTAHNIDLRSNAQSATATGFASPGFIKIWIVDSAGTIQTGPITYVGGGSWTVTGSPTTAISMPASTTWYIRVDTQAATSSTIAGAAATATIDLFVEPYNP